MSGAADTRPTVLVLHKLTSEFTYGVTNHSPARLRRLIEALTARGWRFDHMDHEGDTGQGRGSLVVSFDDGYEHLVEGLPEFVATYYLRPMVFMPTDLEGQSNVWDYSHVFRSFRHLSRDLIRRLADSGVIFGSHGASHRDLTHCSREELAHELSESRKQLQDWSGQSVDSISYPFGRCNQRVCEAAEAAGYRHGFTMQFPSPKDHPLARGRVPVYGFDTAMSVSAKLQGGLAGQIERAKTGVITRLSGGTVWLNRLRS